MSVPRQEQSVGPDPKRASGLFSFFRWFKQGGAEEKARPDLIATKSGSANSSCSSASSSNSSASSGSSSSSHSRSPSTASLNSVVSTGTVTSFSFVPPTAYKPYGKAQPPQKSINPGPVTDTYKKRLAQRDKRRENDKDLTLRKKYNLFFLGLNKSASSACCSAPKDRKAQEPSASSSSSSKVKEKADDQHQLQDNCKSLPLMTRRSMQSDAEDDGTLKGNHHRRANSECSKVKKSGAFCHVKGKRRAPQPPAVASGLNKAAVADGNGTMSLRRKKRLAPQPPASAALAAALNSLEQAIEYADADVLYNDSLKLDNGILKPAKNTEPVVGSPMATSSNRLSAANLGDAPVSPRPWYKRNLSYGGNRDSGSNWKPNIPLVSKLSDDYEPINAPVAADSGKRELAFLDNDLNANNNNKKKDEKRKSGMSFLTNISELDREAAEIVRKKGAEMLEEEDDTDLPPFMRPKAGPAVGTDSWISPKRKSARDLIAKFNAITNVTKVTVNSAFFPKNDAQTKREFFGKKSTSVDEAILEQKARAVSKYFDPQNKESCPKKQKSESPPKAATETPLPVPTAPPATPSTPKLERKSWYCPKCSVENDYWRIICHVCSTIKPYFDDLTVPPSPLAKNNSLEKKKITPSSPFNGNNSNKTSANSNNGPGASGNKLKPVNDEDLFERVLQRSRTQIGFPTKSNVFEGAKKKSEKSPPSPKDEKDKREEREKLKKMLIEMKNSLPKRKLSSEKHVNRRSVIQEDPAPAPPQSAQASVPVAQQPESPKPEDKVAEITVATTETIYENVRVKRTEHPKPVKVSSSAQTNPAAFKKMPSLGLGAKPPEKGFELIRAKDFVQISANGDSAAAHIYANLLNNANNNNVDKDQKNIQDLTVNLQLQQQQQQQTVMAGNTDTLEINRLLRRLESAIAKGELKEASVLARDLAQLKVNCSVVRQKSVEKVNVGLFTAEMYVEDRVSHRGPFPIQVSPVQTVLELKRQVEKEFQIPFNVQRWILGKQLASDDSATLRDHNVTSDGCPIFLYLVAPPNNEAKAGPDLEQPPKSPTKPEEGATALPPITQIVTTTTQLAQQKPQQQNQQQSQSKQVPVKEFAVVQTPPVVFQPAPIIKHVEAPKSKILGAPTVVQQKQQEQQQQPPLAKPEPAVEAAENADYDNGTLKANSAKRAEKSHAPPPPAQGKSSVGAVPSASVPAPAPILVLRNDWECDVCTLLNPISSNICAVCASIRKPSGPVLPILTKPIQQQQQQTAHQPQQNQTQQHYKQLVDLDNTVLVKNVDAFECVICLTDINAGDGVTLRECLHQFCKPCLAHTVEFCEEAEVKCPYRDHQYACDIALQDREVKALVSPAVYEQHLAKSVAQAENKAKSFHCKTPDCRGWCIFEDNVNEFRCPVCRKVNCLTCQAIHMGVNCKQYQERMKDEANTDIEAKKTREMLEEMVAKGEALKCPTCQVVLMKKWGCDWLRCSMCKTEICWVTRGPRWGPAGKGDVSGGCQCGVNGIKCHPQCNYCH